MAVRAERYHDISCGHRVYGHESKCRHLHGHNYRITFTVEAEQTDDVGRVLDFSVIKSLLCMWVERHWDHKFLVWENDPLARHIFDLDREGVVLTPFNPTAENMAIYLVQYVGPSVLPQFNCRLVTCKVEETRKCSASYTAKE